MIFHKWFTEHFKYKKGELYQIKQYGTSNRCPNTPIGWVDGPYKKARVRGKIFKVHQLVWFYFKSRMPSKGKVIDHINRDGLDNRIQNLRTATRLQNSRNREGFKRRCKFKGVVKNSESKNFSASIAVKGKKVHLGSFKTQKEAALAYDKAALKYFKSFAKLNFRK